MESKYYYECHVTIEPIGMEKLELLKEICKRFGFHTSEWYLQKQRRFDFFCTSRGRRFDDLNGRMSRFLDALKKAEFIILRYKIEDTMLDSKIEDSLRYVAQKATPEAIQSFDEYPLKN